MFNVTITVNAILIAAISYCRAKCVCVHVCVPGGGLFALEMYLCGNNNTYALQKNISFLKVMGCRGKRWFGISVPLCSKQAKWGLASMRLPGRVYLWWKVWLLPQEVLK